MTMALQMLNADAMQWIPLLCFNVKVLCYCAIPMLIPHSASSLFIYLFLFVSIVIGFFLQRRKGSKIHFQPEFIRNVMYAIE